MTAAGGLDSGVRLPAGTAPYVSDPAAGRAVSQATVSLVVDARSIRQSGIGRYLRAVLAGLVEDRRFREISLVGDPEETAEYGGSGRGGGRVRTVAFAHGFYSPAAQLDWWRLRLSGALRADLVFFPHYDVPLWPGGTRRVVTVHDLNHFRLPELYPAWKRAAAGGVLDAAVAGAARVLVPSRSTRQDLVERLPAAAGKVEVIPQGVEAGLASLPRATSAGGRMVDELRPFLLCVGNRKRSKNLVAAVEALAELVRGGEDLRLVVAGQSFAEEDEVGGRARDLGVGDRVVEVGAVSDAELRGLYARAECLVFPSLYEGFGLPPLEAMAMGLPVVASNRASTPEVVGDAGILVEPSGAALASAVRRVRGDPALREELIRRGRVRAEGLTWERTAATTAEALLSAARSTGPILGRESGVRRDVGW
jgi:glycosyltransferase involved in cell wall biosynthesis